MWPYFFILSLFSVLNWIQGRIKGPPGCNCWHRIFKFGVFDTPKYGQHCHTCQISGSFFAYWIWFKWGVRQLSEIYFHFPPEYGWKLPKGAKIMKITFQEMYNTCPYHSFGKAFLTFHWYNWAHLEVQLLLFHKKLKNVPLF